MNISLNHDDVTIAIEQFIVNQGIQVEGKSLQTTITCGRGPNGVSAAIELIDKDSLAAGPEEDSIVPEPEKTEKPKKQAKTKTKTENPVETPPETSLPDVNADDGNDFGGLFDED